MLKLNQSNNLPHNSKDDNSYSNCYLTNIPFVFSAFLAALSTIYGLPVGNERWKAPCGTQLELISNIISKMDKSIKTANQTKYKLVSKIYR